MPKPAENEPIFMLNVLWFKHEGGDLKYQEYMKAAQNVLKKHGGRKLDSYVPDLEMIGKFDADLIFFVEWPSWEVFQNFIHDEEFVAVKHLREEAIKDSLLVRCHKPG